jgi:hypothetical protein
MATQEDKVAVFSNIWVDWLSMAEPGCLANNIWGGGVGLARPKSPSRRQPIPNTVHVKIPEGWTPDRILTEAIAQKGRVIRTRRNAVLSIPAKDCDSILRGSLMLIGYNDVHLLPGCDDKNRSAQFVDLYYVPPFAGAPSKAVVAQRRLQSVAYWKPPCDGALVN